ncbi:MAG: class I SAM-dependent methyltransferase [Bacteroides sp.]|nr:class I SAM-dependent methyltransferase [Bacteroides sp.]
MDERSFFDNLAPTWDDNEVLSTPEKVRYVLDFIDLKPGQSVLDLGTGTGVLLPFLAERIGDEGKITAVDYSEGMLSRAIEKFSALTPKPEFLSIDFENETIPGEYDHILLYSVYPHLHTPFETIKWLRAVNLAENGVITVAFPTGPDFINNIHRERHSDSDILPPAEVLATTMRNHGLDAHVAKADETCYIINIYKNGVTL